MGRKRYVYKKRVTYKDHTWDCRGTSVISQEEAEKAWKVNRDNRIAEIDGLTARKAGKIKLKEAMLEWYDLYERDKVTKGQERSQMTIDTDLTNLGQILDSLGNKLVCDIDADTLQSYFKSLADKGYALKTIQRKYGYLRRFFSYWDPVTNPMLRCHIPKTKCVEAAWVVDADTDDEDENKTTRKLAYTDSEMVSLTDILLTDPQGKDPVQAMERGRLLVVILWEFLRLGEAVELRVKDIDFQKNIIRIRRQYQEKIKMAAIPKDNSRRVVPISGHCLEILEDACRGKKPGDLVFCGNRDNAHGGRVLRGALRDTLESACRKAGITRHTVHDLRHDGISYLVRKGVKPDSIQKWAGHKSIKVTLEIYYRISSDDNEADMAIISGGTDLSTCRQTG